MVDIQSKPDERSNHNRINIMKVFNEHTILFVSVFTYGGCTNNYQYDIETRDMYIIVTDEVGSVLVEKIKTSGSNNIAELWAIEEALLYANSCGVLDLDLYSDSKTALSWLDGVSGKTKLTDGAKGPATFAGHYRIAYWGVRLECSAGALIDLQTGRIFQLPVVETQC